MISRILYILIVFLAGLALGIALIEERLDTATDTIATLNAQLEPHGVPPEAEHVLDLSIVRLVFKDASEMPPDTEAQAEYIVNLEESFSLCRIEAQFPTHTLNDPIMESIGHELLHCIVGNFHP